MPRTRVGSLRAGLASLVGACALAGGARADEPGRVWRDVYGEGFGWSRVVAGQGTSDFVPTLRVRGLYQPWRSLDVSVYAVAQATRDLASEGATASAGPLLYADDVALLGGGVLARLWGGRAGLFAQAGAAVGLLRDGKSTTRADVRAGAYVGLESARCWPQRGAAELRLIPCSELYAEAVYASRFADDVVGVARARTGATYAITGPVAWGVVVEGRGALDRNADYYDNFAEVGAGLRWKLLAPVHVDLVTTVVGGSYLGRQGRDPAPSALGYGDLRVLLATYLEY